MLKLLRLFIVLFLAIAPLKSYAAEAGMNFSTNSDLLQNSEMIEPNPNASGSAGGRCSTIGCCDDACCIQYNGFFAGVGVSYNSIKLNQNLYGAGSSNVFIDGVLVATGLAGGPTVPFVSTQNTLAPVVQAGFMKDIAGGPWLFGTKFSYKYLGLNFDDQGILDPQGGGLTPTINAPSDSTFSGHEIFESVQTAINHQLSLYPLIGKNFGRGQFYAGGGPVVFSTQANIYRAIGFADLNGVRMNITGDPVNFSNSSWMWGGGAQVGFNYFFRPSCFIDFSYDFVATGYYTIENQSEFTSQSGPLSDTGVLFVNTTRRITAQSIALTVNFLF